MYNSDENNSSSNRKDYTIPPSKAQNIVRTIFGIIMILIYVGMGIALLCNAFGWAGDWAWTRYVVGIVLIIYGFWRGYRQYSGIDSRI